MGERQLDVAIRVNGEDVRERVEARKTLVDFLREDLGLTGSHIGCEQGVCGACTVLVDGEVVRGCLVLAVQCDGAEVETIEGISEFGAHCRSAGGVPKTQCAAMRILHTRNVDRRAGAFVARRGAVS